MVFSLEYFCFEFSCNRIAVGTSSSRIAENVLVSALSQRGFNIPLLAAEQLLSSVFPPVMFYFIQTIPLVRPMKSIPRDQLCYYAYFSNLPSFYRPEFTGKSISKVTRDFLSHLQSITPGTLSNVVRTAEKLVLPSEYSSLIPTTSTSHPRYTLSNRDVENFTRADESGLSKSTEICVLCREIINSENKIDEYCLPCKISLNKSSELNNFLKELCFENQRYGFYYLVSLLCRKQIKEYLID